jgi:DNA invertase Pin-like site-specific DNA recombinase
MGSPIAANSSAGAIVEIVDDDLGRSGGGINRPGCERLLAAICEGRVGAVFAIEASRLARNGRDWHTLIELCGLVGTVIVDEDGIYDPRHPNDRLLLGMKGTMSELELSLFRQRSQEALKQKARRGALFLSVAAGYVKTGRDRIEKDPDQRVQDVLKLVFAKFAELQTVRQVHGWLREEGIAMPTACQYLLDRVREEPAGDRQQYDRQGKRPRQRRGAARRAAPRRPSALWPLRSQNVRGLWRCERHYRATYGPARHHQGVAGVPGCALGDQSRGCAAYRAQDASRRPLTANPAQQTFDFQ